MARASYYMDPLNGELLRLNAGNESKIPPRFRYWHDAWDVFRILFRSRTSRRTFG